jgi:dephospho-CoA kinase
MSLWPGKHVIGLTGNIATGKSVVRKMLEHLGAYGIDADALGHRAIAKDAPGYRPVVDTLGKWILAPDGQIDRSRLGRLVFSNPEALNTLEDIIHPLVLQAVGILAQRANQTVIVIEAIKLLESGLRNYCDTIWVADASEEIQIQRLTAKRKMSLDEAKERIHAQSGQDIKLRAADIVIQNNKSYEDTWKQVTSAWELMIPSPSPETRPSKTQVSAASKLSVRRASPKEAQTIANFITHLSGGQRHMTRHDVMEAFGEKAFLFLVQGEKIAGILGWRVENLVARVDDFFIEANIPFADAMRVMTTEVEKASRELQCEAALLFLPSELAQNHEIWQALKYSVRAVEDLGIRAWQDAAMESMHPDAVMLFKQLRKDRVLRPV